MFDELKEVKCFKETTELIFNNIALSGNGINHVLFNFVLNLF